MRCVKPAEINLDAAYRIKVDGPIAEAARVFFQRLRELEERSATDSSSALAAMLMAAYEDLKAAVTKPSRT